MTDNKQSIEVQLAVLQTTTNAMRSEIHELKVQLSDKYVTSDQFEPIKRIVYGLVALILIAVVSAVVKVILT